MGVKIKIKKTKFLKELEKGVSIKVKAGILQQDEGFSHEDRGPGANMATVALYNEKGTKDGRISSRPALGTASEIVAGDMKALSIEEINKAIKEGTFKNSGHIIGDALASEMKNQISGWSEPPNSEATIKKKGFNNPLVNTGDYLKRIAYSINEGRSFKLGDES